MEQSSHIPKQSKKYNLSLSTKTLAQAGIGIVLIGVSFYGGVAYQKSKNTSTMNTSNTQMSTNGQGFGGNGQFGPRGGMMSVSTVTAITNSSITVKTTDGTSKTYAISSDTSIIKDGATASSSDIAVGNTVAVMASSSDSSTARRIIINPQAGGGMMGPQDDLQTQSN